MCRRADDPPPLASLADAHLRVSAEFQAVFGEGRRLSGNLLPPACAAAARRPARPRLGVTVSKRVDKHAVGRNRIAPPGQGMFPPERALVAARRLRVLAKPEAAKADNAALRAELLSLFERARTLKPMAPPGTMPPSAAIPGRLSPPES